MKKESSGAGATLMKTKNSEARAMSFLRWLRRPVHTNIESIVWFGFGLNMQRNNQGRIGGLATTTLKPTQLTFFTIILYNLENSVCDIRRFCPLFCHSSVVKYTSSLLLLRSRNGTGYQILLNFPPYPY